MKWVVLVIAALNLGYLGYWLSNAEQRQARAGVSREGASVADAIGDLQLLAELQGQTLRLRRPRAEPDASAPPSAPAQAPPEAPGDTGRLAAVAASDSASEPDRGLQADTPEVPAVAIGSGSGPRREVETGSPGLADAIIDNASVPARAAKTRPPAVSAAAVDSASGPAREVQTATSEVPSAAAGSGRAPQCFTVGPLEAAAPLAALQRWFEDHRASAHLGSQERREVAFHWVFFAPFADRSEALAKLAEMRGKGVADIVVMRKGDMANAISLGAFSSPDAARRRVRELNAKGYQPSSTERSFARLARWMDVVARQGLAEADFRLAFPAVQLNARQCERAELETPRNAARSR